MHEIRTYLLHECYNVVMFKCIDKHKSGVVVDDDGFKFNAELYCVREFSVDLCRCRFS